MKRDGEHRQKARAMTMKRSNSIMLAGVGIVLLIAARGAAAWGGVTLSGKTGGWLPWIGGGVFAFGLYPVIQAFGVYDVIRHIRGRDRGHPHPHKVRSVGISDREPIARFFHLSPRTLRNSGGADGEANVLPARERIQQ